MKNNELKFLANLAKQTLMNKDYSAETKTKRNTVSSYYIQNARALKRLKAETNYVKINTKEYAGFIESVKKLLEKYSKNQLMQEIRIMCIIIIRLISLLMATNLMKKNYLK